MRTWVIEYNDYPPGPNELQKMNLGQRMRSTKRWRELGGQLYLTAGLEPCAKVRLSVTIFRSHPTLADDDNDSIRFKHFRDGLVGAGLVSNDKRQYMEWLPVKSVKGARGFKLVIQELAADAPTYIEELESRIVRLRAALEQFLEWSPVNRSWIARAALEETDREQ